MNENIIRAATDLIDVEPSDDFLAELGRQLLAGFDEPMPAMLSPLGESTSDVVVIADRPSHVDARRRRRQRIVMAVAACLAIFVAAALILNRANDSADTGELADVDPKEALPLAEQAAINTGVLGDGWNEEGDQGGVSFSKLEADVTTAMPQCAALADAGVWTPTTKSVTAHQYFKVPSAEFMYHDVMVFASAKDASKAMDVIESDLFRQCTFDRFDQLAQFWPLPDTTSRSTAWDGAPEIAQRGDRQVIIGQYLAYKLTKLENPGPELMLVNAYIQVGRAIVWVDPLFSPIPGHSDPMSRVDAVLDGAAAALEKVFGK